MVNTTPWLSDAEIDDMCAGLTQDAARVRHLRQQGLTVTTKPNGRPLVMRAHAERVLSGMPQATEITGQPAKTTATPDRTALIVAFTRKQA
jgi:hypothetical protein